MTDAVLAIDLGTSATKLLLVDRDGGFIARHRLPHPTRRPTAAAAEQDPEGWWTALRDGIPDLLTLAPRARIATIGVTGQMHGLVALDATGRHLRPAITWQDRRSARTLPDLLDRLPASRRSGIAPGYQAASWDWLTRHEPNVISRTASILLPKDEIVRRLTGVHVTDPSDAIGTGWYARATGGWDVQTARAAGADISLLPAIAPSGSIVGTVVQEIAGAIGVEAGLPVVIAGGDAAAGAFGAGATSPGTPLVMLSTGCQVLEPAVERPERGGWPAASPAGLPCWLRVATTRNGGNVVTWARDRFGEPAASPDDDLVFLPYLDGECAEALTPDAAGAFIGLRTRHTAADMVRAAIDGVALAVADAFARAGGTIAAGPPLLVGGGGVRDGSWLAATASAFGRPVLAIDEPDISAWGAARSAAAAVGWIDPTTDPAAWLPPRRRIEPEPADPDEAAGRLRRFQRLSVVLYGATGEGRR